MSGIKDQEKIDDLRQRLYERGAKADTIKKHSLSDHTQVKREWAAPPRPPKPPSVTGPNAADNNLALKKKNPRSYRLKLLLVGAGFFALALLVSSFFLFYGRGGLSGENISLSVSGPFTLGGGEVFPLQIGIRNDNTVPMQEATLIIQYPPGTRSVDDTPRDLFIERQSLETVGSGQTLNVPIRVAIFGEEDEEKVIRVSLEYRVQGSSATFFKEAEPLRFKISSSPIVVRADALKRVSPGQETTINLTVSSNSLTPLSEILVRADYPNGFEFVRSEPSPSAARNLWLISDLEPSSSQTISITGLVSGQIADQNTLHFSVGIPDERDENNLAAIFATASTEFELEDPFLGIRVGVSGAPNGSDFVIDRTRSSSVTVEITNTLPNTIYDARVVGTFSGSAFQHSGVDATTGFYSSSEGRLLWDVSNTPTLEEIPPGASRRLTFRLTPNSSVIETPAIDINIDVHGRRVRERGVAEELIGSVTRTARVAAVPTLRAEVAHGTAGFSDTGPVPPQADQATSYTLTWQAEGGLNPLSNTTVTATLPSYVTWASQTSGDGQFTYNQTNRQLAWQVGDLPVGQTATASFRIVLTPSVSQIGSTPSLTGDLSLSATDTFANTSVSASHQALTTKLPLESGYGEESGQVRP